MCNYRCKHCFAHFGNVKNLSLDNWKKIVDNCCNGINVNCFNIAGGEPLLYKELTDLVKYIRLKGKDCTLITNGSLMTDEWIKNNAQYYSVIGFSIDSFNPIVLTQMGRCGQKGQLLDKERVHTLCNLIKHYNPNCEIKINTVVSYLNYNENLSSIIIKLPVTRWKLLKIKRFVFGNFDNSDICCTDKHYSFFVQNNAIPNINIVCEKDLVSSYIMIDSNGNLVNNNCDNYKIVANCLTEDFSQAFLKLELNESLYKSRYE